MLKRIIVFILSIIVITSFTFSGAFAQQDKVRVILDTDFNYDVDDVGAVAVLHALADKCEAEILAIGISDRQEKAILALDAMNTWYNRPDVPIGVVKSDDAARYDDLYTEQLAREYPRTHTHWNDASDAPDVIDVYRSVLANEPDIDEENPGVLMVSIGFMTNFRDLLLSQPDEHSELNGVDLVRNKVRLWVSMAGTLRHDFGEFNLANHREASKYAYENWPTPIVFSLFEIGADIYTGAGLKELTGGAGPEAHFVRRAYELFPRHKALEGHRSWDQASVLYAVRGIDNGPAADYWDLSDSGWIRVHPDGSTTWKYNPNGLHRYKIEKRDPEKIAEEIERLMMYKPLAQTATPDDKSPINISSENPWYWQYKGETLLLLGGSWQDNLFNHPVKLEEHLDVLASVGGNYLRNTMSHRNVGNVFAYERDENGLFDLDRFNPEYWNRFENFLRLAFERDMIVQIELWDPADLYHDHQSFGGWSHHPFNPANNINYTSEESGLPNVIEYGAVPVPTEHPFFKTVPGLDNNEIVLHYQKAYVDKLLSISLRYPNILYCMHNETGEKVEFGDYWADYFRQKGEEAGVIIHTTDMRRGEDVRSEDHAHIFNNPERYTFVDISQNNATLGYGRRHYDNIVFVRERLSSHPRPINNNKNYGAVRGGEEESVARMGRMVFAGAASARFHRPHPHEDPKYMYEKSEWGMGLSPRAQKIIKSLRMATDELDLDHTLPRPDLVKPHDDTQAYLLAQEGIKYAVYFPAGGSASLDIPGGTRNYRWINLDNAHWEKPGQLTSDGMVLLDSPDKRHWIILLH